MKRFWLLMVIFAILIMACNLFSRYPGSIPTITIPSLLLTSPSPVFATAPPSVSITPTAIPTDLPPVPLDGGIYQLKDERIIGTYTVQRWTNPASQIDFNDVVTINSPGQPQIRVDIASNINSLTGIDINKDGHPEVIIETYSGGAHCCSSTLVYSLRTTPVLILQKPESNAGGVFPDLDHDGIHEFETADDLFAYLYCPYAGSPSVRIIMAYDPQEDLYVPASPRFTDLYAPMISEHLDLAEAGQPGELGEWDNTTKCSVLPLVLDYLYSGQKDKAYAELHRLYLYPDVEDFWKEVYQRVGESPLYTPLETDTCGCSN
jgi:hypothetical protein